MSSHLAIASLVILALAGCAATPQPVSNDPYMRLADGDVQLAVATLTRVLETRPDGTSLGWRNKATGHAGTIKPLSTFITSNGYFCRAYQEELLLGEETSRFRHQACRNEEGVWIWL